MPFHSLFLHIPPVRRFVVVDSPYHHTYHKAYSPISDNGISFPPSRHQFCEIDRTSHLCHCFTCKTFSLATVSFPPLPATISQNKLANRKTCYNDRPIHFRQRIWIIHLYQKCISELGCRAAYRLTPVQCLPIVTVATEPPLDRDVPVSDMTN